jgi:hypothetical protein
MRVAMGRRLDSLLIRVRVMLLRRRRPISPRAVIGHYPFCHVKPLVRFGGPGGPREKICVVNNRTGGSMPSGGGRG